MTKLIKWHKPNIPIRINYYMRRKSGISGKFATIFSYVKNGDIAKLPWKS